MPIIDIPEKVCSHCNGTRWYARKVISIKTGEKVRYRCYKKISEQREKVALSLKEKDKAYQKTNVKNLSDRYIVHILVNYKCRGLLFKKDIPQELIKIKRDQLLLKRQIRQRCLQ